MNAVAAWPDEKILIPDLLRTAPQVRPVLDRYGLRGCGGALGPAETLAFFASAHEVPLDRLLAEIRGALPETTAAPVLERSQRSALLADTIYRPFFKAGIAVVLTLGAVWGALLLLRIALAGKFTAVGLHEVNAHGHAQLFGWVGLFVMGFAYQAFPHFKHASLACPRLAVASLWLMLAGLVARCLLEPLAGPSSWLAAAAVTASAVEVVAIGLFVWIIAETWRAAGKPLAFYDLYIVNALAWFVVQAVCETVYLAATLSVTDQQQLVALVATWQAPLRDIQIHGFALLMILGVSQRLFHHFYGLPAPNPRISRLALACLNLAIPGEVIGLVLMRTAGHEWAALWYGSVLLLTAAVVLLLWDWRIFSAPKEVDRSLKFLRAAYVWLLVSLGMLVLLPAYLNAVHLNFSHAYYGATRHAITVGFISLMIVGVAAKVVPTLNGVDLKGLSRLWLPFILINLGCALRVTCQTLTDLTPTAFPVAGVSGLLEVLGLALWGAHLWRIMAGRLPVRPPSEGSAPGPGALPPGTPIAPGHLVGAVLDQHPELLEVFLSFGFHALANPLLRRTVAPHVSIATACRLLNVDIEHLLIALNSALEQRTRRRQSLPVLAANHIAPQPTEECHATH
jgi:hypothetical protein